MQEAVPVDRHHLAAADLEQAHLARDAQPRVGAEGRDPHMCSESGKATQAVPVGIVTGTCPAKLNS